MSANAPLHAISSMATRQLLADLSIEHQRLTGEIWQIESVGGVDAARRVAAGETFDLVLLASDAIDTLLDQGHLLAGSRLDWVLSTVVVAVPATASAPDRYRGPVAPSGGTGPKFGYFHRSIRCLR